MQAELPGEPPIPVTVRHSPRARRISLRVSKRDGRVTLSVPPGATVSEAIGFARERDAWLRRALAAVPPRCRPQIGASLPIEGQRHAIVGGPARRVVRADFEVHVPEGRPVGPALARYLRDLALARGQAAVASHAAAIGHAPPPLRVRDTRSRWGSCTEDGKLMLSWRLAMAPPGILDYVAAHEVAHLVHLDHSPRFWGVVERLYPDWRAARGWLSRHGATLQSVDFA